MCIKIGMRRLGGGFGGSAIFPRPLGPKARKIPRHSTDLYYNNQPPQYLYLFILIDTHISSNVPDVAVLLDDDDDDDDDDDGVHKL